MGGPCPAAPAVARAMIAVSRAMIAVSIAAEPPGAARSPDRAHTVRDGAVRGWVPLPRGGGLAAHREG